MSLLFNGTSAANGFDSIGHYVRTEPLVGGCTAYAKTRRPGLLGQLLRQAGVRQRAVSSARDHGRPRQRRRSERGRRRLGGFHAVAAAGQRSPVCSST